MSRVRRVVKPLIHRPWHTAAIITVMAVACALLTVVLAVVDGVLFRSLGYPGERDLVAIKVSSSRGRAWARGDHRPVHGIGVPDRRRDAARIHVSGISIFSWLSDDARWCASWGWIQPRTCQAAARHGV